MKQKGHDDSGFLPGAGVKGLIIVIVLVVAIVAVAAVAMDDDSDDDNNATDNGSGSDDSNKGSDDSGKGSDDNGSTSDDKTITATTTATGSEKTITATDTDYLSAEIDESTADDGTKSVVIKVTLADSVASEYSTFKWYVKDSSGSYVGYISKTDAYATWTLQDSDIGSYTFGVECEKSTHSGFRPGGMFDPFGIFTRSTDYEMSILITGEVTKTYTWTYDGHEYTTAVSYDYSEFQKYSGTSAATYTQRSTFDDLTGFIIVNDVIEDINADLASKYTATYSTEASGQGYAEFVLAFVQIAYSYLYDESLYGQDEYYAYPMETIQNGGGDCEDTSILAAALFKAAGYSSGVFLIPGHCIAAVSIDGYTAGSVASSYQSQVARFSYTYTDGKTYYGCETTLDENLYGIGWISNTYSIDSDGEVYYTTTNVWGQSSTSNTTTYNGRTVTYKSLGYGFYPASA